MTTDVTVTPAPASADTSFVHDVLPVLSKIEKPRPVPNSITEAVLTRHGGTSPAQTAAVA